MILLIFLFFRLPLPNRPGWMTIVIDMNEVLEKYSEKIDSKSLGLSFDKLKVRKNN